MVERRDYQRYLRAASDARAVDAKSLRALNALLPAPPPAATLWTQGGMLVASALLPMGMWLFGKLDPLGVLLLFFAEGAVYALAVVARILFTAAPPATSEAPRVITALGYALWHGMVWSGLILLALALVAPKPEGMPFAAWLLGIATRFKIMAMWLPALNIALFLAQDVVRRSDYIDAYLERGPREIARNGYVYPMGLGFLIASALALGLFWTQTFGSSMSGLSDLIPASFLALWLIGWRTAMQLLNLTTPLWARRTADVVESVENSLQTARRN